MSIYDYTATLEDGTKYPLSKYHGRPMIIVNTATKCGFAPQFGQLEEIYKQYQDQGLIILGFPSDQFHQEIGDGKAAAQACRTTYGVTFPMHEVGPVNGEDAQPLFKFLTEQAPGALGSKKIKWNFTKFLVDRDGNVVERFSPQTKPENIISYVNDLL